MSKNWTKIEQKLNKNWAKHSKQNLVQQKYVRFLEYPDIQAKMSEIETRDAHIKPRHNAYPSIAEQLDMQYHDQVNGTTTWKDAIAKVKADNPKAE